MRRETCVWVIAVSCVLCGSLSEGQFLVVPGAENTLSVTVTGTAEAPAEWAELALSAEGKGATAQEALGVCDSTSQAVLDELAALQIPSENLRLGPPEMGPDPYAQMMAQVPGNEGEQPPAHTIRRTLTVRMAPLDAEAVYEWFCRVIDVAADAGAALKTGSMMAGVFSSGSQAIAFGVTDPKPLRAEAIRKGLIAAQEAAKVAAENSGRQLGEIAGIQVAELGADQGYLGLIGSMFSAPKPGMAAHTVSLTVTYRLQ